MKPQRGAEPASIPQQPDCAARIYFRLIGGAGARERGFNDLSQRVQLRGTDSLPVPRVWKADNVGVVRDCNDRALARTYPRRSGRRRRASGGGGRGRASGERTTNKA